MRVGLSIYSLWQSLQSGEMTVLNAIEWMAQHGAEHFEMVNFVVNLMEKEELIKQIEDKAQQCNLDISAYCISGNVVQDNPEDYQRELERIYKHIEIARKLGTKTMRCDLYDVMVGDPTAVCIEKFDAALPMLVRGAQAVADYAKQYDITITVENHGTFVNGGDRVRRLLLAVNRDNYKLTLDVGNALCVDESPQVCLDILLPWAATVHFKDFYVRKDPLSIGARRLAIGQAQEQGQDGPESQVWLHTSHGRYLRGAIVGHGDMDTVGIVRMLRKAGYKGNLTVEFEGIEDGKLGSFLGMQNLKQIVAMTQ